MRRQRDQGNWIKKFMVYFIAFIMISSIFGIIFFGFGSSGSSSGSFEYNGFKFVNRGNFWSTNIGGNEALFTYIPTNLELILVDNAAIDRLRNKPQIDTTSDFSDGLSEGIALANYQLGITLNNFNIFIREGFTNQTKENYMVVTCDAATEFVPVINFKSSNKTGISLDNNCIIVEASSNEEMVMLKDRIVYGILGVMQ